MNSSNNDIQQRLLGFDAREYWLKFEQSWPEERKQGFLYRFDLLKPLSVDRRVWPSIFQSEQRPEPDRFGVLNTWADLDALRSAIAQEYQRKPLQAWRMIAITIVVADADDNVDWSEQLVPTLPESIEKNWEFLGYDVADQWLLSALSNCGFLPEMDDVEKFRAIAAPRLNKFHLFNELNDAISFKKFSDQRLKDDHAPCFVYGIWLIKA